MIVGRRIIIPNIIIHPEEVYYQLYHRLYLTFEVPGA